MLDNTNHPTRTARAQRIVDNNGVKVQDVAARLFDVESERDPDAVYKVDMKAPSCTCKDAQDIKDIYGNIMRPAHICKHILAARMFENLMARSQRTPTPTTYDALLARLGYKPTEATA
jgi:hypothetical protein